MHNIWINKHIIIQNPVQVASDELTSIRYNIMQDAPYLVPSLFRDITKAIHNDGSGQGRYIYIA